MAADDFAPAKINLALHVAGQRPDGYHLLDSLVVFAGVGDRVSATPDADLSLRVTGPMASGLGVDPDDNLVLRAARLLGVDGAAITLDKQLPVASGIGGGSADAAATLRLLSRMTGRALPATDSLLTLGADVPVCLAARPCRMAGIGEVISPIPPLPPLWLVLVNPGVRLSTPAVFGALVHRDGAALPPPGDWRDPQRVADWLGATRNDLQPAAIALAPVIGTVLTALGAQPGCLLARMSGSGATCFGLFGDAEAAKLAASAIAGASPGWWVRAAPVLP